MACVNVPDDFGEYLKRLTKECIERKAALKRIKAQEAAKAVMEAMVETARVEGRRIYYLKYLEYGDPGVINHQLFTEFLERLEQAGVGIIRKSGEILLTW